jgi:hypothetical protein
LKYTRPNFSNIAYKPLVPIPAQEMNGRDRDLGCGSQRVTGAENL